MTVIIRTFFEFSLFEQSGLNKEDEKWQPHTSARLAVFRVAFGHLYMSLAAKYPVTPAYI